MIEICILLLSLISYANAFGAGHLTNSAHLDGRSFRHGDISEILIELVKVYAGSQLARQILNTKPKKGDTSRNKLQKDTAKHPLAAVRRKLVKQPQQDILFDPTDVARVYFGNWCRDMSQALDIGTVKALGPGTLTNIVSILGFMAFSRGTREFEVTQERLGCYRPEEHIDNPFGYPDGSPPSSDPRLLAGGYDKLRGPVMPVETEVDPKTGMKNYIANEEGNWDTSTAYIRKSLVEAIELGRKGLSEPDSSEDYWEALRLLGQSLHVLEDFAAHTQYIELALVKLGHHDVFCFQGENIRVKAPNGDMVPPLVSGTFGGADATHSLLGEATDKIGGLGVSDLTEKLHSSKLGDTKIVKKILDAALPSHKKRKKRRQEKAKDSRQKLADGHKEAANADESDDENNEKLLHRLDDLKTSTADKSGDHVHEALVAIFKAHDVLMRRIKGSATFSNDSSVISTFIWATLEPIVAPILKIFSDALLAATESVVDRHKLSEAVGDADFDNPSHSILAKDHLNALLNGPSGMLAQIMFRRCVNAVSRAWNDDSIDAEKTARDICSLIHHPFFADDKNEGQQEMLDYVAIWLERQEEERDEVLARLTKQAVLEHRNISTGLKYGSTVRIQVRKPKKIQYARRGLWGLLGIGCGKLGVPCCSDMAHDSDLEDNIL